MDENALAALGNMFTKNITECINTAALFTIVDYYMTSLNFTDSSRQNRGSIVLQATFSSPVNCTTKRVG